MSLSITINAPVLFLDSSVAAITTLYISSLVLVAKSLSIPKNCVNLFVPNCSSARLNSGWNITIIAITPKFIIPVNIQFNILRFNKPLTQVATIKKAIPFINCHALDPLTTLKKILISNIVTKRFATEKKERKNRINEIRKKIKKDKAEKQELKEENNND